MKTNKTYYSVREIGPVKVKPTETVCEDPSFFNSSTKSLFSSYKSI